jgi:hypothetical protein
VAMPEVVAMAMVVVMAMVGVRMRVICHSDNFTAG